MADGFLVSIGLRAFLDLILVAMVVANQSRVRVECATSFAKPWQRRWDLWHVRSDIRILSEDASVSVTSLLLSFGLASDAMVCSNRCKVGNDHSFQPSASKWLMLNTNAKLIVPRHVGLAVARGRTSMSAGASIPFSRLTYMARQFVVFLHLS